MSAGGHSALMGEITAMGHSEDNTAAAKAVNEPVRATTPAAKGKERGGLFGLGTGADGTLIGVKNLLADQRNVVLPYLPASIQRQIAPCTLGP